ncbi:hypothetical protein L1987_42753 [Smallanthus sonchifolius]|uniref:Uncharacterized protein n=1 Tax=Smallanthus sonchifolius TaxID=185202 RepID=A0ACB9GJL7_9ASTR|nr:hypothetical protein L1987_42753 [Smallanthus sonchifolius]
MCVEMGVPFLGRVPLDPKLCKAAEEGKSCFGRDECRVSASAPSAIIKPASFKAYKSWLNSGLLMVKVCRFVDTTDKLFPVDDKMLALLLLFKTEDQVWAFGLDYVVFVCLTIDNVPDLVDKFWC